MISIRKIGKFRWDNIYQLKFNLKYLKGYLQVSLATESDMYRHNCIIYQWRIQDFLWGGGGWTRWGGHGPPTQVLYVENVCKNERIGSRRGACVRHAPLDPPMYIMKGVNINNRLHKTQYCYMSYILQSSVPFASQFCPQSVRNETELFSFYSYEYKFSGVGSPRSNLLSNAIYDTCCC